MDWAPDGSLFVGQTKHTWAGGEGIQQIKWNGETPFEIQNMELQDKGFKFTFTKPVNREIASKRKPGLSPDTSMNTGKLTAPLDPMKPKWKFRRFTYPKTLKR